jgi:putative ABC transport system permease protein
MAWLRRWWNALRPGRVEREIRREVSFHIAERTDDLRAAGLSEQEAARRARAVFGNPTLQSERTRDADVSRALDTLVRDLRYAFRTLARTPGFTVAAIATLALGIGANATVFSALDAILLRPLPFPEADRLVRVIQTQERGSDTHVSPPRLEEWNRLNSTFEAITGYYVEDVSDTSGDLPERIRRAFVTPRFVEVWRVAPARGRAFSDDEHRFGGPAAALISERYWRGRLAADADVLRRTLRIGNAAIPIVGVMPATFHFPDRDVDVWSPAQVDAPYAQSRQVTWYSGIGRLLPGITPAQARENLRAVQAQLAGQYPDTDATVGADVEPLKQSTVAAVGPSLWLLFGAVTILLLIACTNIAALLLARAAHRRHEIAVRVSLGASRRAVAAQLLTETAVVALAGGAGGLLMAFGAARVLRAAAAALPRIEELAVDWRVLLYTLACTVLVALLCGLLPAFRTAGLSSPGGMAGRTQVSGQQPLQWLLVGAQVALSVTLLAAAGLLVRSFHQLSRVDPGFETERVLTLRVSGSWGETADYGRLVQRIDTTIEALAGLPGVESVATSGWELPGVPQEWGTTFELVEERSVQAPKMVAEGRAVSPEYFATMRIPVVAGALCRRSDGAGRADGEAAEGMVNRAFVDRYLAGRSQAAGLHLRQTGGPLPVFRIVGVVADARERGLDQEPGPTVYWCSSAPNPTPYFVVRTQGDPQSVAQDVRVKMKELDPLRSVYHIAPLEERIGEAFAENRLRAIVLGLFAAAALSLTTVGLYATLSYIVSLRRREVGLRLALGAARRRIVSHFLAQGLGIVALGCACGIALALGAAQVLTGMLFGVSPYDPLTLAGVVATVLAVTTVAVLVPAARAAFIEPMQVLRDQ